MSLEHTQEQETASLEFIKELRAELVKTIDSIGGRDVEAIEKFVAFSAHHINKAAEGYVLIRSTGRTDCSKLLVRPMMETMFRLVAVRRQPSIFYEIAFTEWQNNKTMFREAAERLGKEYRPDEADWERFRDYCRNKFPGVELRDKKINVFKVADVGGLGRYYSSFYRLYCRFTHAALEAVIGDLDRITDKRDNPTVAMCVFSAIESLVEIGASCPNFEALKNGLALRLTAIRGL